MEAESGACPTPVLFLIHRRPELAMRVLAAIRSARPRHLLVAADGPADDQACAAARELVLKGIDWPCRLECRFLTDQLGCRRAVSTALDWAFSLHEELIVLEDDCVPHPDFFPFCEAMLRHYQDNPLVMQVCGSHLIGMHPADGSYYFSRFGPVWGWASWRRAWQAYDVDLKCWPAFRDSPQLRTCCPEPLEAAWRRGVLDATHLGRIDTWDYQWAFAKMRLGGLSVVPGVNLVSNIGFGPDATHTQDAADPRSCLATHCLTWPLIHPRNLASWEQADRAYLARVVGLPPRVWSLRGLITLLRHFLAR